MFGRPSIADYYRELKEQLRSRIINESDERILNAESAPLAFEYVVAAGLPRIEIDLARQSITPEKYVAKIPAEERESFYQSEGDLELECERVVGILPIKENYRIDYISQLDPSHVSLSWSPKRELELTPTQIKFTVQTKGYGFNHSVDENKIMSMVKDQKNNVMTWVERVNHDIDRETQDLTTHLISFIDQRKVQVIADRDRLTSLGNKLVQL